MTRYQPDQAAGLKSLTEDGASSEVRVITVTSGKGGVGKTNTVANLALSLGKLGKKVLIMDADLSLANIDILLGIAPDYHIGHVLSGERSLPEVLVDCGPNVKILPASSGIQELSALSDWQKLTLLEQMDTLDDQIDILLIDTAAGIGGNVVYFNLAAQDRIVLVTPEPTSLTDAYALIKVLATHNQEKYFKLLVNQVRDEREAKEVYRKLVTVADRFLNDVSLDYLGSVPADESIRKAVRIQQAVVDAFPDSPAAQSFRNLARFLVDAPVRSGLEGNIRFFFKRLFSAGERGWG